MFGEKMSFNIDGKESFDTCCGSLCTVLILAVVALYALFQVRLYNSQWQEVPILSTYEKSGFYDQPVEIRQDVNDFYFAVAISGKQKFQEHTTEAFESAGGKIDLTYVIEGGEEDGKVMRIEMLPCSDFKWYKPRGIDSIDRIAKAHMEVKQFFCPSAFDMSFYGSADDVLKKVLFVDISMQENEKYLDGKHLAVLMNTREIEFFDEYEQVRVQNFTSLNWMPINSRMPTSNLMTFTNHEFWLKETEFDQYKLELKDVEKIEWISLDKRVISTPYSLPVERPDVKGQIIFQTSHDLLTTVHRSDRIFFINILALAGGTLFILIFVISIFFKLWVSWLMHLTIVRNLFKIDPSQEKKPKSTTAMKRKDPKVLLAEARAVAKKRVNMTQSCCDKFILTFEAVLGTILCKATKFGKILGQGRKEIEEEFNVYNYM